MCQAYKQTDNKNNRKEQNSKVKKKKWKQTKENLTQGVEKKKKKLPVQYSYVLYSSEYLSKNMN